MSVSSMRSVRRRCFGFVLALAALASCADPPPAPRAPTPTYHEHDRPLAPFDSLVVATAHRGHLQIADYPFSRLDDLLAAFKPDLVLVEIRPEPFRDNHLEDGPLEMSYVTVHARELGIAVEPIDWFLDTEVGKEPTEDPAAEKAFEAEFGALAEETDRYAPFAVLNGAMRARAFLEVENARARYGLVEAAAWHRRQSWFQRQAYDAIERHHALRVASFVGFAHRPELDAWLVATGGRSISPIAVLENTPELAPRPVDEAVLTVWRDGIERLRKQVDEAQSPAKERLAAKVRAWVLAVEHRGLCCVDDKAFAAP